MVVHVQVMLTLLMQLRTIQSKSEAVFLGSAFRLNSEILQFFLVFLLFLRFVFFFLLFQSKTLVRNIVIFVNKKSSQVAAICVSWSRIQGY